MSNDNKPNIELLGNRVLIEPKKAAEKTAGGIIIPESAREKPLEGTVIIAGAGEDDKPMVVKEGNKIYFSKFSGTEVTIDDKDYVIMREPDVVMILNEDGTITPIGDRIVIELPSEDEKEVDIIEAGTSKIQYKVAEKRKSGLIIVDSSEPKEKEPIGKITAIGGGILNKKIKIGDQIFYGRFTGTPMQYKGKECVILRESDIILILTGSAKIVDKTTAESQL